MQPHGLNVRGLNVLSDACDINIVSLVVAKAVVTAAAELGVLLNTPPLELNDAGIADPSRAISCLAFRALLREVSERLNDPYAGIRLATNITANRLHFVGPFLLSSNTLEQACERFQLARRLVLGGPSWQLERRDDTIYFGHRLSDRGGASHLLAQFTATLAYRLGVEFLGDARAHKLELRLALPKPGEGCPPLPPRVAFESDLNGIAISQEEWSRPRSCSDETFANDFDQFVCARFLSDDVVSTWANRVRQVLLTCEQPRCVELEQISAQWNVSARTIRRRLEAEGVQYKELREELCMELAMKWLALEGLRPVGAADRLGYREVNSFRRAFRRHFGTTPGGVQTARSRNDESSESR